MVHAFTSTGNLTKGNASIIFANAKITPIFAFLFFRSLLGIEIMWIHLKTNKAHYTITETQHVCYYKIAKLNIIHFQGSLRDTV